MDRILGHKPATHPSVVLDTLSQKSVEDSQNTEAVAIDVSRPYDATNTDSYFDQSSCTESSTPSRCSSACAMPPLLTATTVNSEGATITTTTKKKEVKKSHEGQGKSKRKHQMRDVMDPVVTIMKEMKDSDTSLLVELEEKRLRYENARVREQRV